MVSSFNMLSLDSGFSYFSALLQARRKCVALDFKNQLTSDASDFSCVY